MRVVTLMTILQMQKEKSKTKIKKVFLNVSTLSEHTSAMNTSAFKYVFL